MSDDGRGWVHVQSACTRRVPHANETAFPEVDVNASPMAENKGV